MSQSKPMSSQMSQKSALCRPQSQMASQMLLMFLSVLKVNSSNADSYFFFIAKGFSQKLQKLTTNLLICSCLSVNFSLICPPVSDLTKSLDPNSSLLTFPKAYDLQFFLWQRVYLAFLLYFYFQRYLRRTCYWIGMKWNLGQSKAVCLALQVWHSTVQYQSMMCLDLSRRKVKYSQSFFIFWISSRNGSQFNLWMTEYPKDLISQFNFLRVMNSWAKMKGLELLCTFTSLATTLLYFDPNFLQMQPIFPFQRTQIAKLLLMVLMVSSGQQICLSMCLAILQMVLSSRQEKNGKGLSSFLLVQQVTSFLQPAGRFSMKDFSQDILNLLRIYADSLMKCQILLKRLPENLIFLSIPSKIFRFFQVSQFWDLILLIKVPRQLMLQEKAMQLANSMKMTHSASLELVGTISPKPTVSMMVVAQQYDQIYLSDHQLCQIPFKVCQL